jgi:predicted transcriptional regulator
MTNKQIAIRAIRDLPDDISLKEIAEEIAILEALRKGEEAADAGDLMPHEEFKRQVKQWLSTSNGAARRGTRPAKS